MKNYKKELHLFDLVKVNILSLVLFAVFFVVGLAINLFATGNSQIFSIAVWLDILISVIIVIVGVIAHESIHAIGGIVFGKCKKTDIKFGVKLKEGVFYCHIDKELTVKAYRIMLILPVIITGIIPYIFSVMFGSVMLVAVFSILIAGGAGDTIMFLDLLKKDKNSLVIDHPDFVAYYLLYDENNIPSDFVEATEENEKAMLEENAQRHAQKQSKSNGIKLILIVLFLVLIVAGLFVTAKFMTKI